MASTSSSDESSKSIPTNFKVSSSDDGPLPSYRVERNQVQILDETVHLCPLCKKKRRNFTCRTCVRKGNIIHSSKTKRFHRTESLSDKQQKYLSIQASLKVFSKRFENLVNEQKSNENTRFLIKHQHEKLHILKALIAEKREKIKALIAQKDELQSANTEKFKILCKYPAKVAELEDFVLDRKEKVQKLRERNQTTLDRLKLSARQCIHQLVEFIFPITEVVLKDDIIQQTPLASLRSTEPIHYDEVTVAALAEAKNTSYIRGQWIFHGSGIIELQYCIVAPSLPANGDYSAYVEWLSDNKDDVPKSAANEIAPSRVTAFRIVGALTYTSQLTQLMSFYLNVRLPYRLAYGDFSKKLEEHQFHRKVSRLNSNILYLAYTQRVKLSTLNENHTLENILAILDLNRSDLGRYGFNEVSNAPLVKSVDSLLLGIETTSDSESEDEKSLRLDWEAVSNLSAQQEIMHTNVMTPASQQSTIAEGLITSAANRLTSMLRWMK